MTSLNYHIDQAFPYKLIDAKASILSTFRSIIKIFAVRKWNTGIFLKFYSLLGLNRDLYKLYLITSGILKIHTDNPSLSLEDTKELHQQSKAMLLRFSSTFATLEHKRLFRNKESKQIAENTLSNLYKIEFELRKRAYSEAPIISEDRNLTEFASALSLSSLEHS